MPRRDAEILGELARRHDERLRKLDGGRRDRVITKMPENYYLPRTDRADVPAGRRDPLPPRPPRRGRLLLADELQRIRWANHFDHIAGASRGIDD